MRVSSDIPFPDSVDVIVSFLAKKIAEFKVDGVYLDGRESSYTFAGGWARDISATGWRVDINGDGRPDTHEDMVGQYIAWTPVLTSML